MATSYLDLTNEILRELNEIPLTSNNFTALIEPVLLIAQGRGQKVKKKKLGKFPTGGGGSDPFSQLYFFFDFILNYGVKLGKKGGSRPKNKHFLGKIWEIQPKINKLFSI